MVSAEEWLKTYHHLGSFCPYYCNHDNRTLFTSISSAIRAIPEPQRQIDSVAVTELVVKSYILGDRTLVRGISRTPWMARPGSRGEWEFADLPEHGHRVMPAHEVAQELKRRLLDEASSYLEHRSRVGILLSGGMDSRVLAGIVRELQLSRTWTGDVVAFTWGVSDSRDVKYAHEIANMCSWEWIHLELTPDLLRNNILLVGKMGAEFAPKHLHAMPLIAQYEGLDAVLAATYGDGVGRAEYSGTHLINLQPILSQLDTLIYRPYLAVALGVMNLTHFEDAKPSMLEDAYAYRKRLGGGYHNFAEIEQQMHYLRRKLQAAMSCIGCRIPLYQLFTAPNTFGWMWSLDPRIRTDAVYLELLNSLPSEFAQIPWARTGRQFGTNSGPTDPAPKEHHRYGLWLRRDLYEFIRSRVLSDAVAKLGIFNMRTLEALIKLWPRANTITTNAIDELLSWLASLAIFVERYHIAGCGGEEVEGLLSQRITAARGLVAAWVYQLLRERVRN